MKTFSRSKSFSRLLIHAVALGLFMPAGSVGAASVTLCATTAKELYDDLAAVSDNGIYAGQDAYIYLAAGTYKTGSVTGNGPFAYTSTAATGVLSIYGGFGPNCDGETLDATLTVLDGGGLTQVLNIQNENAEVDVFFLTIQNGKSTIPGGGVAINTNVNGGIVYLHEDIIQNNHTTKMGGGFVINGTGNFVSASDNLVTGNSADGGYGGGYEFSNGPNLDANSNTFANNTTTKPGGTGGLYCCGNARSVAIQGNIFWDNTNYGIDLETPPSLFEYNDYGTATGLLTADSTNLSVDPKFIDASNGNYRLASNSPLLGIWPSTGFPTSDLAGDRYPFPVNGYYDLGAYEDTVFTDHGFEGK
jgi:hypothetical protein